MSSSFSVEPAANFCDDDSESDEIDAYYERRNILNQKKLENLKKLCAKMDLESEEKRREFLRQFDKLIGNWNCPLLNLREFFGDKQIENLLMESIKYINRDESYRTTEGFIAFVARTGYKIPPKIGNDGKPVPHRTTLIHIAANYLNVNSNTIKDLFKIYDRFDVNYICPSRGSTHFHLACKYGCDMIVQEFFKFNQDPNCLCRKTHDSPLHLALENSHHGDRKTVIELLLKNGANPNSVNANGSTPLHVICQYVRDDLESTKMLFELGREKYRPLQLDVRDGSGNAPVHWALRRGNQKVFRLLLERGADANATNAEGSTPLHILCNQEPEKLYLANSLFKFSREKKRQPLEIDARDSRGRTPLHLALQRGRKKIADLLLTKGADQNLPDEKGMPPIHMCLRSDDSDFVKILFKVSDKKNLPVQVNVCYENYTPLQYAVKYCLLDAVELLLDHGADLSNLVFPPTSYFDKKSELKHYPDVEDLSAIKLMIVSGTLIIAERLEKNGYKFDQSKVVMVMEVFDKQEMFNTHAIAVKNRLCADTKFVSKAKQIAMNSCLSLYDLVRLRPEEADTQLTYKDYFDFARKKKLTKLDQKHREDCVLHLSEIMSRRFFRRWAQDANRQLSGDPQSQSCDKIIDKFVTNRNLYRVCLTAAGQNS